MSSKLALRVVTLLSILVSNALGATTFYVSTTGSDGNSGFSSSSALRSPQVAVNKAVSGDTVLINQGVYDVGTGLAINQKAGLTVQGQGSVIFRDSRGLVPTFRGLVYILNSSNITIRGLRLENSAFHGIRGHNVKTALVENNSTFISKASGIQFRNSSNITVRHNDLSRFCDTNMKGCEEGLSIANVGVFDVSENVVHDALQVPTAGPGGGEGIDVKDSSSNGTVRYNRVYNLIQVGVYVDAYAGVAQNIKVYGNRVNNTANGIMVSAERGGSVRNVDIFNNVSFNNGSSGIQLTHIGGDGPRIGIRIYHNTVVGNGYARFKPRWEGFTDLGQGIIINTGNVSNILVANNIAYNNSKAQIQAYGGIPAGALSVTNNLSFPALASKLPTELVGAAPISGSPQFVNPLSDFHLRANSPAIGAAFGGAPRPVGDADRKLRQTTGALDIGAYAFRTSPGTAP